MVMRDVMKQLYEKTIRENGSGLSRAYELQWQYERTASCEHTRTRSEEHARTFDTHTRTREHPHKHTHCHT